MNVSIFGIGYVGAVSAACLARDGHRVLAVDVNPSKVADIQAGRAPIVEKGLPELIAAAAASGALSAGADLASAVISSELSLVCVGTPSRSNGSLDLSYAMRVADEIGRALADKSEFHSVVFRSTMTPGSMQGAIIPALERASGKTAGVDFGVGYYPEFLRESSAIADYDAPGAVVFGSMDAKTLERLHALQPALAVTPFEVPIDVAETVKYFNNAWHALKISFSNEAGNICRALEVDSHRVMDILCSDTRLNISAAYMKPGFAFGGSCLPKDLRALRFRARELDIETPILDGVMGANAVQLNRGFQLVEAAGRRAVGMIGLSFKSDTDDLRESPLLLLAETLIGKGYALRIFDPNIRLSRLTGANLAYVRERMPHIASLLSETIEDVVAHAETVVIGQKSLGLGLVGSPAMQGKQVVDLVRVDPAFRSQGDYEGLCW
jgi:GDP-mannose 6-dehydrogenase